MNKFLVGGLAALLVAGVSYMGYKEVKENSNEATETILTPEDRWVDFIPNSGRFKVLLPGTPQYAKDEIDIPETNYKRHYEIYASEEHDGTVYMINVINYPKEFDTSNVEKMLETVVHEFKGSRADNKLGHMKKNDKDTPPNADFKIENNEFVIAGRAYLDGRTIVVLSCIAPIKMFNEKEFERYVNSFVLLKKNHENGDNT